MRNCQLWRVINISSNKIITSSLLDALNLYKALTVTFSLPFMTLAIFVYDCKYQDDTWGKNVNIFWQFATPYIPQIYPHKIIIYPWNEWPQILRETGTNWFDAFFLHFLHRFFFSFLNNSFKNMIWQINEKKISNVYENLKNHWSVVTDQFKSISKILCHTWHQKLLKTNVFKA